MSPIQKLVTRAAALLRHLSESLRRGQKIGAVTEVALFLCGLTLLAIYGGTRLYSRFQAKSAITKFEALSQAYSATDTQGESGVSSPEVDLSGWDARRVRAYKASLLEEAGAPLAVLEIPRVHLQVPVFDGADDRTLDRGAGRIAGTAWPGEPGNIGIAAHRDSFFRALKDVKLGDSIDLKSLDRLDTYTVDRIEIVTPKDASVLEPRSAPSITLVTCYPFYFVGRAPQRYIVSASLSPQTRNEQDSERETSQKNQIQKGESHEELQ